MRRKSILIDTTNTLEKELKEIGIANAIIIANQLTDALIKKLGGRMIYFPMKKKCPTTARDEEIYRKFNGDYEELAKEYDMSERWLRGIISRQQKKRQGKLAGI